MPSVAVTMIEGYSEEAKERLCSALTGAVRQVVPAQPDGIIIALHEVPAANYMRGGKHRQPAPALPDAAQLVRQFLGHMEARDLGAARAMLAHTFTMTFPGGVTMNTLEDLIAWAKPRYSFVRKTYERFDTASGDEGPTVYCYGTLSGEWLDGTAFEGIRFMDRFETSDGKLTRQDVWNDMGEMKNG
ncbi:MAG: tautomerase family protein [Hyphomicrobiales bacterium]|jgi:4-oxalocrotonate tautomerase family enzyme